MEAIKTMMARSKKACIVFFDEVDVIGGARFDDGVGGDNEVQRTTLEIVNQLDGFGYIKVLMATNILDPALLRLEHLNCKVEFGLPDLESRTQIFKILTGLEQSAKWNLRDLLRLLSGSKDMSWRTTRAALVLSSFSSLCSFSL